MSHKAQKKTDIVLELPTIYDNLFTYMARRRTLPAEYPMDGSRSTQASEHRQMGDTAPFEDDYADSIHGGNLQWRSLVLGLCLICGSIVFLISLLTYNVQEMSWTAINGSGIVAKGCSNMFGVIGLYSVGLIQWLLGAGVWLISPLMMLQGAYIIMLKGEYKARLWISACVLLVGASILLDSQSVWGSEWMIAQGLKGSVGGWIGSALGRDVLRASTGVGGEVAVGILAYTISLIYVMNSRLGLVVSGIYADIIILCRQAWAKFIRRRENKRIRRAAQGAVAEKRKSTIEVYEPDPDPNAVSQDGNGHTLQRPESIDKWMLSNGRGTRTGGDLKALGQEGESTPQAEEEQDWKLWSEQEMTETASLLERTAGEFTSVSAPTTSHPHANTAVRPSQDDDDSELEELEDDTEEHDDDQSDTRDGELPLVMKPRIVDSNINRKLVPAEVDKPFGSHFSPPTKGYEKYVLPGFDLLKEEKIDPENTEEQLKEVGSIQSKIIETLKSFGVPVTAGDITRGSTITLYEIIPSSGIKLSKITTLEQNLALATRANAINILAPIPGRGSVGIEIANKRRVNVLLSELLLSEEFTSPKKKIPIALGKDVYGNTVVGDLSAMPHLLVAGATGSGKSVCINSIISSILFKFRPDEMKFILVDPKVVEMMPYSTLPHLIVPVVTEPKKVPAALRWCVMEMERRYRCFATVGKRDFNSYNGRDRSKDIDNDDELESEEDANDRLPDRFPYIVVIIDELADLMQVVKADIETYISRLTAKARAAGIHLIVATQSPRSEVVTGTIKANIPCRIAFKVSSQLDSRIILDNGGAEKLIGQGDLLYLPPGTAKLERAQGAFISEEEVEALVAHCSKQVPQQFHPGIQQSIDEAEDEEEAESAGSMGGNGSVSDDDLYSKALQVAVTEGKISISLLQRRLFIGFGRAARIFEMMEKRGVIAPSDGTNRPREVLM